ncbi:MAG: SIS domain-containing protein, partial [Candidatus Krumholzibacteriia bacterium]
MYEARRVLDKEIAGLRAVQERLGTSFVEAVELLWACSGRVIVTGVGKSGIVAKKIAATLTSTGTRSLYLHPVEAAHGDMGILAPEDVLLAVSYSGANDEFDELFSAAARMQIPIVSLTGSGGSRVALSSKVVIDCRVPEEACPLNLAPTASTTAALAVGDALAVALLKKRGFRAEQFALTHPSGVLGRRLVHALVLHAVLLHEPLAQRPERLAVDRVGRAVGLVVVLEVAPALARLEPA